MYTVAGSVGAACPDAIHPGGGDWPSCTAIGESRPPHLPWSLHLANNVVTAWYRRFLRCAETVVRTNTSPIIERGLRSFVVFWIDRGESVVPTCPSAYRNVGPAPSLDQRSHRLPSSPRATPQFCGSDDVRIGDRCDHRCGAPTVRWRDRSEPSQYLVRLVICLILHYSVTKEQRQSARRQKPSTPRSVFRQTSHTPRQAVCRYPCKTTIPWWWQMRGVGIDGSRASSAARFAPKPVGSCSRTVVRRTREAGGRHRSSGRSTSERTPGSPVSTATASGSSSNMSRPPTSPSTSSSASK